MSLVHIDVSPKQLSKLRNGHKVRIKPVKKGEGFNLYVDPSRYRPIHNTFLKGKGYEIQLTPDEILQNRQLTPEYHLKVKKLDDTMSGKGIFGKTFDKYVEKVIGTKAKDTLYKGADMLKQPIKMGIDKLADYAPEIGASSLTALAVALGQPELIPLAGYAGMELGKLVGKKGGEYAKGYLDNPDQYQDNISHFVSNIGGSKAPRTSTLSSQISHNDLLEQMNNELGTNMGNLGRANIATAIANRQTANMMPIPVEQSRFNTIPDSYTRSQMNKDLFRGYGLKKNTSIVGTNGSQLNQQSVQAPALRSQAGGANFQFGFTLPPTYQKYHKGIGSGLYI